VKDANGNIVGQKSSLTGKIVDDPRAVKTEAQLKQEKEVAEARGGTTKQQFGGQITVKDENGNLFFATTRRNPNTGEVESVLAPMGDGIAQPVGQVQQVGAFGLTASEQVTQKADEAKANASGKGNAERIESSINEGIDASQGAAILHRSLDLLNEVETGGFDNVALKAKKLFGVESADEAELSANLGKAVLSQLRTVFGAAFTEREGARLEGIEASFGKSTAGNKRLLEQTLRLVKRTANRGIKAAIEAEDYRAAADIQELLDFRLDDDQEEASTQEGDIPTGDTTPEGYKIFKRPDGSTYAVTN
jgi:hypothetical protein